MSKEDNNNNKSGNWGSSPEVNVENGVETFRRLSRQFSKENQQTITTKSRGSTGSTQLAEEGKGEEEEFDLRAFITVSYVMIFSIQPYF